MLVGRDQPELDTCAPNVDQRVIDAWMDEQECGVGGTTQCGLAWDSVVARGRELGLTRRFIEACRITGSRPAMRPCVNCDERFLSSGVHNRMCNRCRTLR